MAKRRFYRGLLPTVVWNPAASAPLAIFERGQFVTEDDEVAEKLIQLGYTEVSLEAETPPPLPDPPIQPKGMDDVPVMSGQYTEEAALSKHKREEFLKSDDQETEEAKREGRRKIKRRSKES